MKNLTRQAFFAGCSVAALATLPAAVSNYLATPDGICMPLRFRAWILGFGAVPVLVLFTLLVFSPPDGSERAQLAQFVGRFHPLAIHLPIALLLLVPVLEVAVLFRKRRELEQSVAFVLGLAAIAAITSALLGWLLAWSGGYQGSLVTQAYVGRRLSGRGEPSCAGASMVGIGAFMQWLCSRLLAC